MTRNWGEKEEKVRIFERATRRWEGGERNEAKKDAPLVQAKYRHTYAPPPPGKYGTTPLASSQIERTSWGPPLFEASRRRPWRPIPRPCESGKNFARTTGAVIATHDARVTCGFVPRGRQHTDSEQLQPLRSCNMHFLLLLLLLLLMMNRVAF